jgi:hypothetical protein
MCKVLEKVPNYRLLSEGKLQGRKRMYILQGRKQSNFVKGGEYV